MVVQLLLTLEATCAFRQPLCLLGRGNEIFEGVIIATARDKNSFSNAKSFKNISFDTDVKFDADCFDRYCVCVRLVGMVRGTRYTVGNESDENVFVFDHSTWIIRMIRISKRLKLNSLIVIQSDPIDRYEC